MLHVLLEAGLRPDFVVGSSVGAINAAYFAGAPDIAGVSRLADIWLGLRRADIFPLTLSNALSLFRHPDSIVDPSRLRHMIEANLSFAQLEDARIPLHVMATDQQGVGVRLSTGPAADAILASAAVPGIFPPVAIDGRQLMDGAIAANTPLRLAVELGATQIFVLPTGYACALEEPPKGVIAKGLHAVTLLIAWQLMHEIERHTAGHSGAHGANALPARNLALRLLRLGAAHRARNAVDEKVDRRRRSDAAGPLAGPFGTSPLIHHVRRTGYNAIPLHVSTRRQIVRVRCWQPLALDLRTLTEQ